MSPEEKAKDCIFTVPEDEVARYQSTLLPLAIRWIGNPLDWSLVDKGILCGILAAAFDAMFVIAGAASQQLKAALPYFNFEFIETVYPYLVTIWALFLVTIAVGFWLRKRDPENRWFPSVIIYYGTLTVAFYCYAVGPVTHPGLIVGFSGGLFYLLLFGFRAVVIPVIIFAITIVWTTLAAWAGYIPYAPLFKAPPYVNGRPEDLYLTSTLGFVVTLMLLMFIIMAYMVDRWRDRERQVANLSGFLKQMFGRYLSPEVMQALIDDPASIQMGGTKRKITILMTDLRGFTQFSERLDPQEVVGLLNRYYEVMVRICKQYGGTVNDIIGDALLVTFGAPKELLGHARAAVACAIEMQNAMADVNAANVAAGLPELEMGIGINTAEVVVGNIGSEERAKFGVVGAGVNMASRIESYTVGGQILVSGSVLEESGGVLRIDGEMEVRPKGAENAIRIYDVGGISGKHNLALQRKGETLATPARPVRCRYTLLDGKHVGESASEASLEGLSPRAARLSVGETLPPNANLKMNLSGVSPKLARLDFYGKVAANGSGPGALVHFTAVPPEVATFFEGLIGNGG